MNSHDQEPARGEDELASQGVQLFRKQALEAHQERFGAPVRPVGIASWALTSFMAVILVAVGVFLLSTKFARKETVIGILEPTSGAVKSLTLRPGVVSEVHVVEGQEVVAGDPLVSISLDVAVESGASLANLLKDAAADQAEAMEHASEARLDQVEQRAVDVAVRRRGLGQLLQSTEARLAYQQEREALSELTASAFETLHEKSFVSTVVLQERQEALISIRQGVLSLEAEIEQIQAQLSQLDAEERRLEAESNQARAELESGRAQMEEKKANLSSQDEMVIVAERSGIVTALQVGAGSTVGAGDVIGIVLPEGVELEAQLWTPSRAAGFVQPGDRVRLMYDAFPYQQFGVGMGTVREVAKAPTDPNDLPVPIDTPESLYRVRVALDQQYVRAFDKDWSLSPGMRLAGDVVLAKRSLFEWMMEPVIAARQRSRERS